jgi:hypothetical protein
VTDVPRHDMAKCLRDVAAERAFRLDHAPVAASATARL